MDATNQVLKIYTELRKVKEEMLDYSRQYPNGVFRHLFKVQLEKIEWCYKNTTTSIELNRVASVLVNAIRDNWDLEYTLERDALRDRLEILNTEQLKSFDEFLNYIETGREFVITFKDEEK